MKIMPKYVLYRVRNCSQDIVAENCNLWLLKSNLQDLQVVYTYIYTYIYIYRYIYIYCIFNSIFILVITAAEPSNLTAAAMNPDVGRRQYLATYSQADESKFSTWENLGKMLEAEFNAGTSIVKWTIRLVSESSIRMMTFTIIACCIAC